MGQKGSSVLLSTYSRNQTWRAWQGRRLCWPTALASCTLTQQALRQRNRRTCPRVHTAERAGEEGLAVLRHEAAVQSVGRHVIVVAVEADLAPMQRWGGCQGRRSWAANNSGELAMRRRQLH